MRMVAGGSFWAKKKNKTMMMRRNQVWLCVQHTLCMRASYSAELSEDEASSYAPSGSEVSSSCVLGLVYGTESVVGLVQEEDSEEYASDDSSSDEEYGDSEDEEAEDWEELEKRARQGQELGLPVVPGAGS